MSVEKNSILPEKSGTYTIVGSFITQADFDSDKKKWHIKDMSTYESQVNYWLKEDERKEDSRE